MAQDPPDPATITKRDLVNRISDQTGQPKMVVRDVVQMFLDYVVAELAKGNRLEFREFGVFEVKTRGPRRAQNPRTLEKVDVPGKRVVKFKTGRLMRERICAEPKPEPAPKPVELKKPATQAPAPPPASPPARSNSPF